MDVKRLLSDLIEAKFLTAELAAQLEKDAAALKKDVESLIYERRLVGEEELARTKSQILGIPFKKIDSSKITPELLKLIPAETQQNYRVVPISKTSTMLVVGMVHPDNSQAQQALRFIAKQGGFSLGVYLITPSDADAVLRQTGGYQSEIQAAMKALGLKAGQVSGFQRLVGLEDGKATVIEEAPVIKLVAVMLKEAVTAKASDIHIEPQRKQSRIRFRIDGALQIQQTLPPEIHQPITSRVKVLSNLKLDETRIPQDGRFRTIVLDREIDFRVATFPTPFGEKVVLRVLDPEVGIKGLDELGLTGKNRDIFLAGIKKPFGMVLITGPTGSGKTTTLYATMQILNKEDVNIVSLEDPVEYSMEGLNQSQVKPEIGYDFASGLRQILRQDPDVIMVGEIRDSETATLAVHAALTGHIVLSTLHTNNSIGVIPRLADMKVDTFLLPSALNLMVAQRLLGRLCENCKEELTAPKQIAEIIKASLAGLPEAKEFKEPYKIFHAPGCSVCKNRGTVGRLAIYEVFQMMPQLAEIISEGISENKIMAEAKRQGMLTMHQDGIIKALRGLVAAEDVIRETEEA